MFRQSILFGLLFSGVFSQFFGEQYPVSAAPGEFPFIASIRTSGNNHLCSGFIVSDRWIATSAHAVVNREVFGMRIIVGASEGSNAGTIVFADTLMIHEDYNPTNLESDIALIRTRDPIIFSDLVKSIPLANEETESVISGTTVGWRGLGWIHSFHSKIITHDQCLESFQDENFLHETSVCAVTYPDDPSFGLGGDVLVVENTAAGLFSWGLPRQHDPDVYTRIFPFREWILSNVEEN